MFMIPFFFEKLKCNVIKRKLNEEYPIADLQFLLISVMIIMWTANWFHLLLPIEIRTRFSIG